MRKAIKQISFLIFALTLNLVWANWGFDDITGFQNHLSICNECQDISGPFEYSHSISCEDDVFMNDSKVKSNFFEDWNEKVPFLKDNFRNEYLNKVWQPPKFS